MDARSHPQHNRAMAKRTPRRRRHSPRRKPPTKGFLDTVLEMLSSTAGTVMAGAGVVLLSRILGEPVRGRIELPEGIPQEVVDEWGRLCGHWQEPEPPADPPPAKGRRRSAATKEQPAVELVKGEDGVYRPKEQV